MSGHSKWSKIKHQKGAADVKRGKTFSLLARQISQAVRDSGSGDPNLNSALFAILEKAKEANLPKDNIQRAIDRGLGKGSAGALTQVTVEGYGPGGVAILIMAQTDNPNRTKSQIRTIIDRGGGSIGEPGSVAYIFSSGEASYRLHLSEDDMERFKKTIDSLEQLDDVEKVRHNADN